MMREKKYAESCDPLAMLAKQVGCFNYVRRSVDREGHTSPPPHPSSLKTVYTTLIVSSSRVFLPLDASQDAQRRKRRRVSIRPQRRVEDPTSIFKSPGYFSKHILTPHPRLSPAPTALLSRTVGKSSKIIRGLLLVRPPWILARPIPTAARVDATVRGHRRVLARHVRPFPCAGRNVTSSEVVIIV